MVNEITAGIPSQLMAPEKEQEKSKGVMGKDDFLMLLMTQLRHQDPVKPMDHTEFATQLAQFSQLEQLSNIGAGIKDLRTDVGGESKLQALGLIGKHIEASGSEIRLIEGKPVSLMPVQKEGVKLTKAAIFDSAGKLVTEIDLSRKSTDEAIAWDGKGQDGRPQPSGTYLFRVHGVGRDGKAMEIGTELSGKVTGVELDGNAPVLMVDTGQGKTRVDLTKVRRVDMGVEAQESKPESKPDSKADLVKPDLALAKVLPGLNLESKPESEAEVNPDSDPLGEESRINWGGFR